MKASSFERINGHPIRCYDAGAKHVDRYTVVYLNTPDPRRLRWYSSALCMSDQPTHPQGVGHHSDVTIGSHLGRRIRFAALPLACQQAVLSDCKEPYYKQVDDSVSAPLVPMVAYSQDGKVHWAHHADDRYLLVARYGRTGRYHRVGMNFAQANAINMRNGRLWLMRAGKRYLLKTTIN